jgi:hypothetical protein
MNLKYDAPGLICMGASVLRKRDRGTAYALFELAENLRRVMADESTFDEFKAVYSAAPVKIDPNKEVPA